jgi:predicted phosphodiesterase
MRKADLVRAALEEAPDRPTREIAKYLVARYPALFTAFESTRDLIRYHRGETYANKKRSDENTVIPRAPKAKRKTRQTIAIRKPGRYLILSDAHFPYHCPAAIDEAVRHGIEEQCDHLVLNGDMLDAYQQSRFVRDPNARSIDDEIKTLAGWLKDIRPFFKGDCYYKIGNHEDRIESYLFENAPQMIGMSKWDLCKVLADQLGLDSSWQMIASKQLYTLGTLNCYHGHELPKGLVAAVNPARGLWLRTRQTSMAGHFHQASTHIETSGDKRKTWVCFSTGCLCDMAPAYALVNQWSQGFAILDLDSRGHWKEQNIRIHEGKIW